MVALGTLLMILGGLAIAAAVFVSDGTGELLGLQFDTVVIFLLGVAAGLAILWGWGLIKGGTKRAMRERKERKKIDELSAKLNEVEAERKREGDKP